MYTPARPLSFEGALASVGIIEIASLHAEAEEAEEASSENAVTTAGFRALRSRYL